MIEVAVLLAIVLIALLCVEILRWAFRPESRRLRMIKKIGGRR